jgi:hypothetical protein
MNRLRRISAKAEKYKTAIVTNEAKQDLALWEKLILRAQRGISINNVIFRVPTSINLSDSCEQGIAGYSFITGIAWRYELTENEQVSFTLNLKEYLADAINNMMQLTLDSSPHPCCLNITDNSSTSSWMHKSNHDPEACPIHNAIARRHAETLLQYAACDYSQHIAGSEDIIADSLSRDFHLPDEQILGLFHSIKPSLFPTQMKIVKLPTEITSWIALLALLQPKKRELKWQRTPNHWMEWHKRGGSTNTHLQELTRVEKVRTCCGFMHAVRRGDFSRKGYGQVASTTARAAVDHVAATIINGGGEDPRVDGSGKISNLLLRQQRAYKN